MPLRLEGKVAIISGAANGMGAAMARLFAQEGAAVVVGDVQEEKGRQVALEIVAQGGRALFVTLDVAQRRQWDDAVGLAAKELGPVTLLVNNAGVNKREPVETAERSIWEWIMSVNVKGAFLGIQAVAPSMRHAGGGSIVNISSVAGIVGHQLAATYSASKGALRTLTKHAALQLAKDNIRVNSIHPGVAETAMTTGYLADSQRRARLEATIPLGRVALPGDIAPVALFLASDEASYITGAEFVVDGGQTAYFPMPT